MSIDIDKLYQKARSTSHPISIQNRKEIIQQLQNNHRHKLKQAQHQFESIKKPPKKQHQEQQQRSEDSLHKYYKEKDKNSAVGDVDKMMFDKKFKSYLNHKQEYQEKRRKRRQRIIQDRKSPGKIQPGEDYYNQEEILSNTDSDYQYADAQDMLMAYQQIASGLRKKKGVLQLYNAQKFQYAFRINQFALLVGEGQTISKQVILNYLFDQPSVMMLYSINPYALGDQLAEFITQVPQQMTFEQFSQFLLIDRAPTYFQYSKKNLEDARKLGRGLKCSPIVGRWIGDEQLYKMMIDWFLKVDIFGNGRVERSTLAKKLFKQGQKHQLLDHDVIEVVNIGKLIPLSRLIYQIEHEARDNEEWEISEYQQYLENYHRLCTPEKDKLIMKLIMAGKFDPTYIYIVSTEVLQIIKDVFENTAHFAEYYVVRSQFIENLCKHPQYHRIKKLYVRSQSNRYVCKQTVEETLSRFLVEADQYLDIQEILDFFTNRGRPRKIEYQVYIANLEAQLDAIDLQEALADDGDTSSDEEFNQLVKLKKIKRKEQKIKQIRQSNHFHPNKKFNLTIPIPFKFKPTHTSIRKQKLIQMLEQKKAKQDQSMKTLQPLPVPIHVKQNLFERIMKDQEKQRQQRLQRFRLQIQNSMIPVSQHLLKKKQYHPNPREEYKFVARPMPWYCQVNLLERMNRKKQQRRQLILENIINSKDNIPQVVEKMLQRFEDQQARKKEYIQNQETGSGSFCTFQPKISTHIPDFKTIHEHLKVDLEIAKNNKTPIQLQPFSFENRPKRSKTTHQTVIPQFKKKQDHRVKDDIIVSIPGTAKHQGLVQLRRKQQLQRIKKQQLDRKAQQIRKMRHEKFAPYVREVLRKKDYDLGVSREQIARKMDEFKQIERERKRQYQKQMTKIYTKVFNRPLLAESAGDTKQNEAVRYGKNSEAQNSRHKENNNPGNFKKQTTSNRLKNYDLKRKEVIQQEPGNYIIQNQHIDQNQNDQFNYQRQHDDSYGGIRTD